MFLKHGVVLVSIISVIEASKPLGKPCSTPTGDPGECKPLSQCQPLYQEVKANLTDPRRHEYFRRSLCGFSPDERKFCCPTQMEMSEKSTPPSDARFANSSLLPDEDSCGISTQSKIYGGNATDLDEYPWMVLLDYEEYYGTRSFKCGGAVITPRYVLTAAHCLTPNLKTVHLGVYNQSATNVSCIGDDCNEPVVKIDVEKMIPFEAYARSDRSRYHDIGLIRMVEEVKYSDFIKPICLPLTVDELFNDHMGEMMVAAGWGLTETGSRSQIKLKVALNVTKCTNSYYDREIELDSGHICAGGEYGKDTCTGDSGGPLMAFKRDKNRDIRIFAIGVTSFGYIPCGGYTPGVYTKVVSHVYWIIDNLEP